MKIISLNISDKKGVIKTPVKSFELNDNGIIGDAHAGKWHRQVSLLGGESIEKFSSELGRPIEPGEFAENITLQGFDSTKVGVLDRFTCGEVILELTQIGKKCHGTNCVIYREVGNCVMPKEGVFCRVLQRGQLHAGSELLLQPKVFKILVITLSDRCFAGISKDASGPLVAKKIQSLMETKGRKHIIDAQILPDEPDMISEKLLEAFKNEYDIIITTGSTGIGPRDIAPEAIQPLLDKEIPGIMDMVRLKYGMEKSNALISRAIAGTKNKTLIFAIPGSPKAVDEYMDEINKIIFHCFNMLYAIDNH